MNKEKFKRAEELDRKISRIGYQIEQCSKKDDHGYSIFCVQHVSESTLEKCRNIIVNDLESNLAELELEFQAL